MCKHHQPSFDRISCMCYVSQCGFFQSAAPWKLGNSINGTRSRRSASSFERKLKLKNTESKKHIKNNHSTDQPTMHRFYALSISFFLTVQANLIKNLSNNQNRTGPRASTGFRNLEGSFDILNHYGCWCELGSHGNGRGQPQDDLDQLCKDLHKGYACIQMDHGASGFCEPWNVDYVSAIADLNVDGQPGPASSMEIDEAMNVCAYANGDECAMKACKVESYFYR